MKYSKSVVNSPSSKSLLSWRRSPWKTNTCKKLIKLSITRKLYPNVDFYSGLIYRAMGFPTDMYPVLFTIPRVAGWIAHWTEFLNDTENNIYRPRQNYVGYGKRGFTEAPDRKNHNYVIDAVASKRNKRREASQRLKDEEERKKI